MREVITAIFWHTEMVPLLKKLIKMVRFLYPINDQQGVNQHIS